MPPPPPGAPSTALADGSANSPPAAEAWVVQTLAQVAEFFELTHGTMQTWRRNGMPGRAGRFDLREIVRWERNRRSARSTNGDEGKSLSTMIQEQELRFKRARADAREHRNRIEQGKYVLRADVERDVNRIVIRARDHLQRIPVYFAVRFPADLRDELRDALSKAIDDSLEELASYIDDPDPDTAAGTDPEAIAPD